MLKNSLPPDGENVVLLFESLLPPVFRGKDLDALTGKILQWRTIQNARSRREIPDECFAKLSPRKVIVLREPFLKWLAENIAVYARV